MLSALLLWALCASPGLAFWPAPRSMTTGSKVVWLSPDIHVEYRHGNSCYIYNHGSDAGVDETDLSARNVVKGAVSRALSNILSEGLVPWKLVPRHELSDFEPSEKSNATFIRKLQITQTNASSDNLIVGGNETYSLNIKTDGTATISSSSVHGILHALQSFSQAFYRHSSNIGSYTNAAPIAISDSPVLAYRGLNLDVARNWYPVKAILRTIDALSWNKFNVLHLHMTDSQSWPIEVPSLPELAEEGSYYKGLTYTPEDIEHIHRYALQRGIAVNIEFDMPGHTTSIASAYPDLIAASHAKPWWKYCAEPPCGTLQLNNPDVDTFLDTLFEDVLPRLKPYTAYFHTGGDEVNANSYTLDPTLKTNDKQTIAKYIQKLVDRTHSHVRAAGLAPIVWEEMLLEWNITLGDDVLVQTWRGEESVAETVKRGHKSLAGSSNYWYLDCGRGGWINYGNDDFESGFPFNDYCSPVKNWRLAYSYDPFGGVPEELKHLVVGGEVHLWSEQTDALSVDDMLWPRASAAGEVMWSGRQDSTGTNRSQLDAAPRLAEMRERMALRGINLGPVQMVFCTQHNATECA